MINQIALAILGPTASGKSDFAVALAEKLQGEIVALDSTTPYKGFNIGSSKPSPSDQKKVRHHLLDILEPQSPFSAFDFVKLADEAVTDICARKKLPLIVGGTYFYLKALQNGMYSIPSVDPAIVEQIETEFEEFEEASTLKMHERLSLEDPQSAAHIHANDRYRLLRALSIIRSTGKKPSSLELSPVSENAKNRLWIKYALLIPRHELTQLITLRTDKMLSQGMIEETENLRKMCPSARALQSIGYSECLRFLDKQIDHKQLRNEIIEKTRQLAKRQMTWLRSDPEVRFIDKRDLDRVALEVSNLNFILSNEETTK